MAAPAGGGGGGGAGGGAGPGGFGGDLAFLGLLAMGATGGGGGATWGWGIPVDMRETACIQVRVRISEYIIHIPVYGCATDTYTHYV